MIAESKESAEGKTCSKCKVVKPLDSFYNNRSRADGKCYACKDCEIERNALCAERRKKYKKQYNIENKEEIKRKRKIYYEENKEYLNRYNRRWQKEHCEELKAKAKLYRAKNGDVMNAKSRKRYADNAEARIADVKRYNHTPKGKAVERATRHRRRAQMANTAEENAVIIEWLTKVQSKKTFACMYCEEVFPISKLHIDHIVPLAKEGRNVIDNLATACDKCNLQKGAKTVEEFRNNKRGQMLLL